MEYFEHCRIYKLGADGVHFQLPTICIYAAECHGLQGPLLSTVSQAVYKVNMRTSVKILEITEGFTFGVFLAILHLWSRCSRDPEALLQVGEQME